MMQRFDPSLAEYYVQPMEKKRALEVLAERIADGESAEDITKIKDKYYREKVVSGLCPMSALIYTRIMLDTPLPEPKEEPRRCIRCGKFVGRYRVYCPECRNDIKRDKTTLHEQNGVHQVLRPLLHGRSTKHGVGKEF